MVIEKKDFGSDSSQGANSRVYFNSKQASSLKDSMEDLAKEDFAVSDAGDISLTYSSSQVNNFSHAVYKHNQQNQSSLVELKSLPESVIRESNKDSHSTSVIGQDQHDTDEGCQSSLSMSSNSDCKEESTDESQDANEVNGFDLVTENNEQDDIVADADSGIVCQNARMYIPLESTQEVERLSLDKSQEAFEVQDERPLHSVELKLASIKNDSSEFKDFMLIFLYIKDVYKVIMFYGKDSVDIYWQTSDIDFNTIHAPEIATDCPMFKLTLYFRHAIVPAKSYHAIKKKSIEIHLQKQEEITWGGICISQRNETTANKRPLSSPSSYGHNQWTPCTKLVPVISNNSNHMSLLSANELVEPASSINAKSKFYGYTGLDNLGNTCFMNSVLQCLANTDPLKNYFFSKQYEKDINPSNRLGTGGIIVREFHKFLLQLWPGTQSSIAPVRLKNYIEKINSTFAGYNQHDAQEFMSFFLDAIHEDLNQNDNRPKAEEMKTDSDDDSESLFDPRDLENSPKRKQLAETLKEKANQMWHQYRLFNNSIIIDLFHGQFRSILTCPDCSKKSITFDPFLYVPLPIPPPKRSYHVIFYARHSESAMCMYSMSYSFKLAHNATAGQLMQIISERTNVPRQMMRLIQIPESNQSLQPKFLNPNWCLADYQDTPSARRQPLLLFQIQHDSNEEYIELCVLQRTVAALSSNSTPKLPFRFHSKPSPVGLPFIISVKKSMLTYSKLYAVMCSYARHSIVAQQVQLENENCCSSAAIPFDLEIFNPLNNQLPRLIFYKSHPEKESDTIAPFILRKPEFSNSFYNLKKEEEITPPILEDNSTETEAENYIKEEASNDSLMQDDDHRTDGMEENNDSALDRLVSNGLKEAALESSSTVDYDNEALFDTKSHFYLAMDWINDETYPVNVRVKVEAKENLTNKQEYIAMPGGEDDTTLDQCLETFNEPEVLGPQNSWRCPSCKDLCEATKQLSFWRFPPILVIQLKRFKMRSVYRDKISQMVKYPLYGLDLSKYANGDCMINFNGRQAKPIYDLYAVVNHIGDAFGGHYTAFGRSFDGQLGWRCFDDCCVEKMDETSVVTSSAYLLFYKCRDDSMFKQ